MRGTQASNRLARLIDRRVQEVTARPDALELGVVQADGSLKLDRFEVPIPAGDYLACRGISPELEGGDRVLVAWCNGGQDPVIVDVVVSA